MTVTTSTARVVHNGNGITTQFAVPFRFLENAHVAVFLRDAAGGQTLWAENTQYTLTGAGAAAGGTLAVITAPTDYTPAAGEKLVVVRDVPITQETDYVENDPFPAETHERALDKATMINQEQTERLDRTFTIPETDQFAGSFVLPGDTARANTFLAFDALGGPTVAVGTTPTTTPVSAFMESLLSTADATSWRTQIGPAPIFDANGNEVMAFAGVAVAVNEVTVTNAATAGAPKLSATGGDTDIGLDWQVKGTGIHQLLDGNGNEILKTGAGVASAVNELTVTNAATANGPEIAATGGDANIDIEVIPKGTGAMDVAGPIKRSGNVLAEEILQSGTVSNQPSLDITDLPAGYRAFKLYFDALLIVSAAANVYARVSSDNGVSFDSGASDYRSHAGMGNSGSAGYQTGNSNPGAQIQVNHGFTLTNGADDWAAGEIILRNPRDSATRTYIDGHITYQRAAELFHARFGGARLASQDDDAFQVILSAGNISTMNWTLTGVRAS